MPAHPEDELLADLAADVLPLDVARQVEAHVMACARCFQVLSDAESVRALLRQTPPEPMPPQVMARLDQALAAVRHGQEPQPMPRRAAARPSAAQAPAGPVRRQQGETGEQTTRRKRPARTADPSPKASSNLNAAPNPSAPPTSASSYRVRPLKRTEGEAAYPAEEETALHPAVRDEVPDPELTQPVRKRRRAAAPAEASAMTQVTQVMRPVRDKGPAKLTRMDSTQAIRVRRQAMEEQKAEQPSRWPRISPQIAAAVVLVMALVGGGLTWALQRGGGQASDEAGTAAASSAPPVLATVQETGTEYRKSELEGQIGALIEQRNETLSAEPGAAPGAEEGTMSAQDESGSPRTASEDNGAAASSGDQVLRSPEGLQACLDAIGQAGAQPLAVDLATYDGREAALIVLPGADGGYDVWIVARTCQPGADGTVAVVEVQS